jgi:PhnB protein
MVRRKRKEAMTDNTNTDQSVILSLTVSPCSEAIDFYKEAFGAEEVEPRMSGPDGLVAHAELRIGNSLLMLGDEWPDGPTLSPSSLGGSTAAIFIYTDDVDTLWQRAIDAGCEVVYPLEMQFYGDKGGRVRDPFGHTWGLGQHVEDVGPEEMDRRMAAFYEET